MERDSWQEILPMISATIPHLFDICATSIVYKLWTHQDIHDNWNECIHWQLLENKVNSDVTNLPLPELVKHRLLSIVKPTGRHFISFLYIWFTKIENSEKWLRRGILSDCLTLYAVGIINQRKTAEKLLKNKTLDTVVAFRLACINFIEEEVLRLWPCVFLYFLNKIILEYQKLQFPINPLFIMFGCLPNVANIQEPHEVLFWIGFCLSKERGSHLSAVPHYAQSTMNWPNYASNVANISGDISFFEYVKNSNTSVYLDHENEIRKCCFRSKNQLVSIFYHFSSLQAHKKETMFREFPHKLVSYFLQWPLSSLFLNYINDSHFFYFFIIQDLLDWLFVTILEILHGVRYLGHEWSDRIGHNPSKASVSDVYCTDHLKQIWTALWQNCLDETKSRIMDSFVFTNNLNDFLEKASHKINFDATTLKMDLQKVFLSNGEAVLKFLEEKDLSDAVKITVAEYLPEKKIDFELLQLLQFSNQPNYMIVTRDSHFMREVAGLNKLFQRQIVSPTMRFELSVIKTVVRKKFIEYIHQFLLWR